jgi:predicted ATP-grasp superfamily ATP-dependent carboligase
MREPAAPANTPRTVAVVGVSARALAQSAARAGWRVVALDVFGDADTRAVSLGWLDVGREFVIAPARLVDAVAQARARWGVQALIHGGGLEACTEALLQLGRLLPVWNVAPEAAERWRAPAAWCALLQQLGLPHPETQLQPPADPRGWWRKQVHGSGGWHIRAAADADADGATPGGFYWQRHVMGEPMSALFLADGQRLCWMALNRLSITSSGPHPFVYQGAIGPVQRPALAEALAQALQRLVPALGLAGLASLDFIATPQAPGYSLLELNPRPSATLVLHDRAFARGLLAQHARLLQGQPMEQPVPATGAAAVQAEQVVWADLDGTVRPAFAAWLAGLPHARDLPLPGTRVAAGQPLCSSHASAATEAQAQALLQMQTSHILQRWHERCAPAAAAEAAATLT